MAELNWWDVVNLTLLTGVISVIAIVGDNMIESKTWKLVWSVVMILLVIFFTYKSARREWAQAEQSIKDDAEHAEEVAFLRHGVQSTLDEINKVVSPFAVKRFGVVVGYRIGPHSAAYLLAQYKLDAERYHRDLPFEYIRHYYNVDRLSFNRDYAIRQAVFDWFLDDRGDGTISYLFQDIQVQFCDDSILRQHPRAEVFMTLDPKAPSTRFCCVGDTLFMYCVVEQDRIRTRVADQFVSYEEMMKKHIAVSLRSNYTSDMEAIGADVSMARPAIFGGITMDIGTHAYRSIFIPVGAMKRIDESDVLGHSITYYFTNRRAFDRMNVPYWAEFNETDGTLALLKQRTTRYMSSSRIFPNIPFRWSDGYNITAPPIPPIAIADSIRSPFYHEEQWPEPSVGWKLMDPCGCWWE